MKQGIKPKDVTQSPSPEGYNEEELQDISTLVEKSPNSVGVLRKKIKKKFEKTIKIT